MTGLLLLVHIPNPERRTPEAQGEESNSLMLDHHLVTDGFGIMRRRAFATIPVAARDSSSTTSQGAGEDEHNYSNSLDGSLDNTAACDNQFNTSPGTQAATENMTGGWRPVYHGESLQIPLDDHVRSIPPIQRR